MVRLSSLNRMLKKLGFPEQPRAERLGAPGLGAQYQIETSFASAGIKDISTSGIYLITEKKLRTDEQVTLVLHKEGQLENGSELRFSVHARVTRQGEDGIGLSFVLPPGLDTDLWGVLVRNIVTLTEPAQIANMFRTLRVILFLCRICQSGAGSAIRLLEGQLADQRLESLVNIALDAEKMLAAKPNFERRSADPILVANILREGSSITDPLLIQLWIGLLVSSCSIDGPDNSNQTFVDLLIHFASGLARIFIYACEQALDSARKDQKSAPSSVIVKSDELIALTSVSDPAKNANSIAYLFNLGLIQKLPDFRTYEHLGEFDITPTPLGLEFYKRCQGDRGDADA